MKRLNTVIFSIVLGISCVVHAADTAQSVNIVGHDEVDKPVGALAIVSAQFADSSLDQLLNHANFVANLDDTLCDRVLVWDAGTQAYITYGLCDPTALGQGTTPQWRLTGASFFVAQTNYVNAGDGLWLQTQPSSTDTNAFMSGDVVSTEYKTNSISAGLNLISSPFSTGFDLNTTLTNGTENLDDTLCDRVLVWDAGTQTYITYGLCDPTALGQGTTPQWRLTGASFFVPNVTLDIPMGQGFWYQAKSSFDWVYRSPYFDNL